MLKCAHVVHYVRSFEAILIIPEEVQASNLQNIRRLRFSPNTHVHVHTHTYTRTHTWVHTHTHTWVHTHTHTHTHTGIDTTNLMVTVYIETVFQAKCSSICTKIYAISSLWGVLYLETKDTIYRIASNYSLGIDFFPAIFN